MDFEEHVHRDGITGPDSIDAIDHGVDVPEHLGCGHVRRDFLETLDEFGMEQPTCPDLQTLDAR